MAFIKLDTGILNSSVWVDLEERNVFLTALLLSVPYEVREPEEQLSVTTMKPTGWLVPPGWYGKAEAAGVGIVRLAGVDRERGLAALAKMGEPEEESRSREYEGRRVVRVNGGFIVLNFMAYREKDHGSAERQRRYRLRKAQKEAAAIVGPDISEPIRVIMGASQDKKEREEELRIARMAVRER